MLHSGIYKINVQKEKDAIDEEVITKYGEIRDVWRSNQMRLLLEKICELRAEVESLKMKIREPQKFQEDK